MQENRETVREVACKVLSVLSALLLVVLPFDAPVLAQGPAAPEPAPASAPLLTPDQLDDLVAPIALYPDPLLSQVLVASTYPLEIVESSQWLQQNSGLQGQALVDAARQQNWDPSIQALVAFPDVLGRLSSNINWTTDLGNAFLAQQADVMDAVQQMRARARDAGRLSSNAQQTVDMQTQDDQTAIQIVPANPQVIYVPVYNPEYIWGPPVWGYYPPLYYPAIGFGFGFGPGIYMDAYFGGWGGWGGWGWRPNWFGCSILGNSLFFNRYGFNGYYGGFGRGGIWAHNPYHRLGVPYSNYGLASRFRGNYVGRGGAVHSAFGGQRVGAYGGGGRSRGGVASMNGGQRSSFGANGFRGGQSLGPQGNRAAGGGWQRFGSGNANSYRRGSGVGGNRIQAPQARGSAGYSGSQAARGSARAGGQWSHFNGFNAAPANRGGGFTARSAPASRAPNYGGGFAGRSTPAYRSSPSFGGGRSYGGGSAPAYRAPSFSGNRSFSRGSSPAARAPSFSGNRSFGGSRPSFSGGSRSFGGGGSRSSGGGSHGGGGSRGGGSHGGRR